MKNYLIHESDFPILFVIHEFKYGSLNPIYISENVKEVLGISKEEFLNFHYEGPSKTLHPDDHNIMMDFADPIKTKGFYYGFQRLKFTRNK